MKFDIIQIGSHIGNTPNDYLFNKIKKSNKIIFIEPVIEYFNILQENYNIKFPNNNFIFLNVACSNTNDDIKIYVPEITSDLPFWVDQLSSVLPNHVENHNLSVNVNKKIVKCITLNKLINDYKIDEIDLLCVDTEGHDFEILFFYNFKIKPKKIIFEHKHIEGTNKSFGVKYNLLINKLTELGYIITKQTEDDTYMIFNNDKTTLH